MIIQNLNCPQVARIFFAVAPLRLDTVNNECTFIVTFGNIRGCIVAKCLPAYTMDLFTLRETAAAVSSPGGENYFHITLSFSSIPAYLGIFIILITIDEKLLRSIILTG